VPYQSEVLYTFDPQNGLGLPFKPGGENIHSRTGANLTNGSRMVSDPSRIHLASSIAHAKTEKALVGLAKNGSFFE
jgi:hypothetical protein